MLITSIRIKKCVDHLDRAIPNHKRERERASVSHTSYDMLIATNLYMKAYCSFWLERPTRSLTLYRYTIPSADVALIEQYTHSHTMHLA